MPNELISPEHVILIYGGGGIGKTNLIRRAAEHIWKASKLRTRVIGADGGGTKPFQTLIKHDILEYWPIDQWLEASIFETLSLATQGWWPKDPLNPSSELLPPSRIWRPCPHCAGDTGAIGLNVQKKCAACKKDLPVGIRLDRKIQLLNDFDKIGLVAFEGASVFGRLMMDRLREKNPEGGHFIQDGDFKIAQSGQSHYLNAQNYLAQFIANSRRIPTRVVIWTALELRGKDEYEKPIYGPSMPGKALTSACIPWFTDVIHLDGETRTDAKGAVIKGSNGEEIIHRKLFLTKHFPTDTKPYGFEAKTSAPDGCGMPTVIEAPEGSNPMSTFFDEVEAAYTRAEGDIL